MRARWVGTLVGAAAVGVASSVGATPADLFGFGPRSQGMAGLGAAIGRGFEATYGNPALLSRSHDREIAVGWQTAYFSLHADGPNAPGDMDAEGVHGEFVGAVLPIPFGGVLEDRVTFGIGSFTPSDLIARARLLNPERVQFPLLPDRAQCINFNLGLGVDLGYGIRVGAGFLALAELVGTVVVGTDSSGRVGTRVDDQLVASYAPVFGAAYDFSKDWTVGATFRGPLEGDFDVLVRVQDLGTLTVPELNISGVAQYDPMQVQAEVGKRLGPWTVAAGATYKRWSPFEGWQRATVECPASEPDCEALVPEKVEFHDTIVPRAGAAYAFSPSPDAKAEIRGGYAFEPTPLGEQKGRANYFDASRHILAFGYGLELAEPLPPIRIDAFVQAQLLMPRTHEKDASVDPANPGFPKVETGGTVWNTGVVFGVKF